MFLIVQSEVTDINKQKFLAELARLLTFMYEEDRQEALAMYAGMFEEAEDEQSLLQALVSPTRQAVVIARAYNAKERKLQVHAQSRDEDAQSDDADFVQAINLVRSDVLGERDVRPAVDENQFSLFDDLSEDEVAAPQPAVQAEETIPEPVLPEEDAVAESQAEDPAPEEDSVPEDHAVPVESEDEPVPEEDRSADIPSEIMSQVDAFLADFSLPDDVVGPTPVSKPVEEEEFIQGELLQVTEVEETPEVPAFEETVRKPKVFLLILYILLAIPVTLAGIVLLLLPTLLFLLLAAGTICFGVMALTAAFSGFTMFSDLLVVLGVAIIVLGLGLLFLWTFVWFIGGAIVGLIHGVVELGELWCYKEVAAE